MDRLGVYGATGVDVKTTDRPPGSISRWLNGCMAVGRSARTGAGRTVAAVVAATVVAVGALAAAPTTASAHEGIAGSDPASGSEIDAPIDRVTIDFGAPIADNVELIVRGPNDAVVPSTTTRTGDSTATAEFETLSDEGTDIVQYLTSLPLDGHLAAGAIQFTYGSDPGPGIATVWIIFGVIAAAVLATGGWLSLRRSRVAEQDDEGGTDAADDDLVAPNPTPKF
jgi:methionine-rich copper-binding protein CopC